MIRLPLNPDAPGSSLAALGLASTLVALAELSGEGAVLAFADRMGKIRMVSYGLGFSAVGYAVLGPASSSLVVGLGVLAATFVAFEITIVAAIPLASEIAPGARTRYLALFMVALGIGRAIGDIVGPMLYTWRGFPASTLTSAVGAAFGLVLVIVVFRGRDA